MDSGNQFDFFESLGMGNQHFNNPFTKSQKFKRAIWMLELDNIFSEQLTPQCMVINLNSNIVKDQYGEKPFFQSQVPQSINGTEDYKTIKHEC